MLSIGSLSGCGRLAVYTATKAFGLNLGESLWAELRHKNVDVLSLVIGSTDTPTLRANLTRAGVDPDTVPLAKPADVASAIAGGSRGWGACLTGWQGQCRSCHDARAGADTPKAL